MGGVQDQLGREASRRAGEAVVRIRTGHGGNTALVSTPSSRAGRRGQSTTRSHRGRRGRDNQRTHTQTRTGPNREVDATILVRTPIICYTSFGNHSLHVHLLPSLSHWSYHQVLGCHCQEARIANKGGNRHNLRPLFVADRVRIVCRGDASIDGATDWSEGEVIKLCVGLVLPIVASALWEEDGGGGEGRRGRYGWCNAVSWLATR